MVVVECDVTEGLMESTKLVWNGGVDLNDGRLQQQHDAYKARLAFVAGIGTNGEHTNVAGKLKTILVFINSGKKSNSVMIMKANY